MRICVFAGSAPGTRPEYTTAARDLGLLLAERNIDIVYGGARVGLMGVLADAALGAGGHVTGVIPDALAAKEIAHRGVRCLESRPEQAQFRTMPEIVRPLLVFEKLLAHEDHRNAGRRERQPHGYAAARARMP